MNTLQDKDGGTAFPCHGPSGQVFQYGMTLRDWFAGMALQGTITNNAALSAGISQGIISGKDVAVSCYEWADLMLLARKESA